MEREGAVALELLGEHVAAVGAIDEAVSASFGAIASARMRSLLLRAGGERADEGYAELHRLLGAFRVQPRAFATYSLGVMLRDDVRAHRIIQDAIERQDRAFAASGGFTPPAPAADPRP